MKLKIIIFISLSFILSLFFLFSTNIKDIIKYQSVKIFEEVKSWTQIYHPEQKIDDKILITNDFVAFTNKLVFKNSDEILLHLTGNDELTVNIFSIDNNGLKIQHLNKRYNVRTPSLTIYSIFDGIITPTYTIKLNSVELGIGWFGIGVTDSKGVYVEIPVYIDASKLEQNTLFVESTDTLLAYNPARYVYSIPNFYSKNLGISKHLGKWHKAGVIPNNTPIIYEQIDLENINEIECNDHLINSDGVHKRNLKNMGIEFQSVSDNRLDDPEIFENTKTIIFGSHNEYWTTEKAINIMNFIENGGRVLFLGGNNAWRKTKRESTRTWFYNKNTDTDFIKLMSEYLGAEFTDTDYYTHAPFKIVNKEVLFDRFFQNVDNVSILGKGTSFNHCESEIEGISGHETDKLVEGAQGFTLLAKGTNDKGGAEILYKLFPSGGEILNFSSISTWHNKDQIIFNMIKNFLNKKIN